MKGILSAKTYRRCLMRSSMLNFMYTAQGLQSVGFLYSIMPGLREIHTDDAAFAESCARYSRHFNCNIFWAPFLAGSFLHLERQIAKKAVSPDFVIPLQDTTLNSLSAVGDSFFSGSLLVTQMLALACLVMLQGMAAACVLAVIWLVLSLVFKFASFNLGLARGMSMLRYVRGLNLINKGDYLKLFNAVLLAAIMAMATDVGIEEAKSQIDFRFVAQAWVFPLGITFLLAYAASRMRVSRSLATIIIVCSLSIVL